MPGGSDNGILIGVVSGLNDPENLGRVQVSYPYLDNQQTDWCRLVTPMAGKDRGAFFRPEVGDEVLVAYEQGDPRRTYVLGSLWSKTDTPPPNGPATNNDLRLIKSRSGHILRFDDSSGGEKIEIVDKDGQRKIIVDSAGSKIEISCATGDVNIKAAAGTVSIEAMNIKLKADVNLDLEASAQVTIKGAIVNIN